MADLQVDDATLTHAETAFRKASNRLGPAMRALKNLEAEVVGADPLSEALRTAHGLLAMQIEILCQGLAELAKHTRDSGVAFGHTDGTLARESREGVR